MSHIPLTDSDKQQLHDLGIDETQIQLQLKRFEKGSKLIDLVRAARVNDGITAFTQEEKEQLIANFTEASASLDLVKFVPASGAATRMFKTLLYFNNRFDSIDAKDVKKRADEGDKDYQFLQEFIQGIKNRQFSFIEDLGPQEPESQNTAT